MSWRSNAGPEPTARELQHRIEDLERQVAMLKGGGGDWRILGDVAPRFRRDALNPALPTPMQPLPMFKPPAAPARWDDATVFRAAIKTGVLCAMFSTPFTFPGWIPFWTPAAVLLMAPLPIWLSLSLWGKSALNIFEKTTGIDINHDGQVGDPPKEEPQRIELEVTSVNEAGRVTGIKLIDVIGIPYDTLMEYFTAIVNGLQLTGPSWKGQTGSISQSKFTALMLALERAGLAENKRSNVGRVLTRAGKKILRRMVEPNPLPRKRGNVENE